MRRLGDPIKKLGNSDPYYGRMGNASFTEAQLFANKQKEERSGLGFIFSQN